MSIAGAADGRNSRDGRNAQDGRNSRDGRNTVDAIFHPGGAASGLLSSALLTTAEELAASGDFEAPRPDLVVTPVEDLTYSSQMRPFLRHEEFYRQVILDYEVNSLFAPLHRSPEATALHAASGGAAVFHMTKPTGATSLTDLLRQQMRFLKMHMVLRDERFAEILVQQTDMLSFFGAVAPLDNSRSPATLALLDGVLRFGTALVSPTKLDIDGPRPHTFSPLVQPMIQTPTHGTLPSGHAMQAFSVAVVLAALAQTKRVEAVGTAAAVPFDATSAFTTAAPLMQLAARISHNRTVAGVHFPLDNWVGAAMGLAVGELFVNAAALTKTTGAYAIDISGANTALMQKDFLYETIAVGAAEDDPIKRTGSIDITALPVSPILTDLWKVARTEVKAP